MTANLIEILITSKNLAGAAMKEAEGQGRSLGASMTTLGAVAGAALIGIGVESVKMATTYESVTTRLVTSAGEQDKNLKMVQQGMLDMAGQVGVSATDLAQAMYYVESAGFHGADGLIALKAAAQGAAAEGADTTTVVKAMTDVLVDYHLKASDAADVTSKMITAVSYGKTSLQDFSGAFASIVPAASAAGISFNDVSAALAEMTNHGFTANRASQNLAQALRSLLNPTGPMKSAFVEFGVSAQELRDKLAGPNGLTDAMEYLAQKAEKAGKEGTPAFAAALKLLMGTAPGANAALATVGENFDATSNAIKGISAASADAQGRVQGFAEIQGTLKQQLAQVRAEADALGIRLGMFLIPQLSKLLSFGTGAFGGIASGFSGAATKPVAHGNLHNALLNQDIAAPPPLTGWQEFGEKVHRYLTDIEQDMVKLEPVGRDFVRFGEDAWQALLKLAQASEPVAKLLGGALLVAVAGVGKALADVAGPAIKDFADFLDSHQGMVKFFAEVVLGALITKMTILGSIRAAEGIVGLATSIVQFPLSQAGQIKTAFDGLKTAWSGKEAAEGERAVQGLAGAFGDLKAKASGALDKILPDSGELAGLAKMSDEFKGIETAVQDADTQFPRFAVNAKGVATDLGSVESAASDSVTALENAGTATEGLGMKLGKLAMAGGIIGGAVFGLTMLGQWLGSVAGVGDHTGISMDQLTQKLQLAGMGSIQASVQFTKAATDLAVMSNAVHKPLQGLTDMDAALAQLGASGHADQAKAQFTDIANALAKQGIDASAAAADFPQYEQAIKNAGAAAATTDGQLSSMQATLNLQQGLTEFNSNLETLKEQLQTSGNSMDASTAAGRANQQMFESLAQDVINYYQQQRNAGTDTNTATTIMSAQAQQIERLGQQFHISKDVVDQFLGSLSGIKPLYNMTVTANIGPAVEALNGLVQRINDASGTVQIYGSSVGPGSGGRALGGMAIGGVFSAAAIGGVQGGWTRMNEDGIELARLPNGTTVMPHANTMAALAGGAASGAPRATQSEVAFAGDLDSAFATAFMRMIREGKIQIRQKAIVS